MAPVDLTLLPGGVSKHGPTVTVHTAVVAVAIVRQDRIATGVVPLSQDPPQHRRISHDNTLPVTAYEHPSQYTLHGSQRRSFR